MTGDFVGGFSECTTDDLVLLRSIIDETLDTSSSRFSTLSRKIEDSRAFIRSAEKEIKELEQQQRVLSKRRRVLSAAIEREKPIPLSDDELFQIHSRKKVAQNESAFLISKNGAKTEVGESLVLGRDSSCGLVISDMTVSRKHARLFKQNGNWWVEDLGSKNGVRLNGEKIESEIPARLPKKAIIRFGAAEFSFFVGQRAEESLV